MWFSCLLLWNSGFKPFFHSINGKRLENRLNSRNRILQNTIKGDDIHLAVDMISLAYENAFDTAVLISGDGDFVPVIQKVQKLGKIVENVNFPVSSSDHLRKVCNKSTALNLLLKGILEK